MGKPLIDMTGQRFDRLLVIERAPNPSEGHARWRCVCDCGESRVVTGYDLRSGHTKSCGCRRSDSSRSGVVVAQAAAKVANTKHGHALADGDSPTYVSWLNMKNRCFNPNATGYENYGGRGITIHPDWVESFEQFLADMGERGEGLSLDRINNDGNYEPSNCRWATRSQQSANRRPYTRAA